MALIETDDGISAILPHIHRAAILGIKAEPRGVPAYYVPEHAQRAGITIVPVPVYFPDVTEILGERVYRRLADIPDPVDTVVVFRRPQDVPGHFDDIITAKPRVVWMQLGIRHDDVARKLVDAGIDVVQDRCLLVELQDRGR